MSVECTTNWVFNSDSIISQLLLNRLGTSLAMRTDCTQLRPTKPPVGSIGSPIVGLSNPPTVFIQPKISSTVFVSVT